MILDAHLEKVLAPRPDAFSDDGFCSPEHGRIAKNL